MESRRKHFISLFVFLLVVLTASVGFVVDAKAQSLSDVEFKKAAVTGLKNCYDLGAIGADVTLDDYKNGASIMTGVNVSVPLPSGYTSMGNEISCDNLILGKGGDGSGSFKGLVELSGHSVPLSYNGGATEEKLTDFLVNMGYKVSTSTVDADKNCIKFHYSYDRVGSWQGASSGESDTDYICLRVSDNGNVNKVQDSVTFSSGPFNIKIRNGKVEISRAGVVNNKTTTVEFDDGVDWETLKGELRDSIISLFDAGDNGFCYSTTTSVTGGVSMTYCLKQFTENDSYIMENNDGFKNATYTMSDPDKAYQKAAEYLLDSISPEFSDENVAVLYQNYIANYYKAAWLCDVSDELRSALMTSGREEVRLYDKASGKFKKCLVKMTDADKIAVGVEGGVFGVKEVNLRDIIETLNGLTITSLPEDLVAELADGVSDVLDDGSRDYSNGDSNSTCEASGAAQSLGWIVCPIMEWMASAAEQIYTDYVEPSLRIEPQLLTGGANATQDAWETFRNIANVVFIIFFMVVIFSQLTGVGIDNYGIKKVLPKLIVIAILVNLSFLICQICVDLSNILGNGLQAMFDSFASNFGNLEISGIEGATGPVAATGGAISAVVILGGVLGVAGLVFNPAMIVTLLIAALGVVISVLFLFALLAARQAAVVVLIILSPLALVCYILPNMKKMFDKWLKLWEAMLLLYPICGLLVGGANYVSKLLIYTGMGRQGLFGAFTAMIVGVVPIFFIPTLVKGAFSAMGKLGGTLAGMGARASGATKKYTRSTGGAIAKKVGSTDTYRSIRNAIGRHSLTKRGRARAVTDTAALMSERAKRERFADRSGMDRRFQSIAAAEEAKASDEATSQTLSLMMSSGEGGGIKMKDGSRKTYTLDNATARMKELESDARGRELTNAEQLEMAALARGMSNMKGGAGKLSGIIRGAEVTDPSTGVKSANGNFMKAMGEIYSRDSAVQAKMNEKDMSASIYTEHFMAGGDGLASNPASRFTSTFATESATAGHRNAVGARVKSHAAGLNQSGAAFDEYLDRLNNSANSAASYQEILDDDSLMNSLDAADRDKVRQAAANKGVTGKTAQFVGEAMYDNVSGGSAQKLMEYSDGTLRDAAGNRYDRTNWKKTMAKVVGEATYQDSKGMRVDLMQMDDGSLQDEFGKTYDRTKWTKV